MNIILWSLQVVLALIFALTGVAKITQPITTLAHRMGFVEDFAPWVIRLIGVVEVLGAIGLILPALTGIWPWLTPLAAVGLVLTMIGALLTHMRRREPSFTGVNLLLLLLALVVAYGRFIIIPF